MTWKLSAFADEAGNTADEQIAALRRAGLRFVDLRAIEGCNITALPLDKAEPIRKKFDAAGIRVNMFGSPIGKIDISEDVQIDLQKLDHLAQLAPVFDCRAVRMFSYYNKARAPRARWEGEAIKRLRVLRDRAGELGLVLYHENERDIFGDRLPEIQAIVSQVRDGKAFRMIFDFDNYHQSGDDVWANWIALAGVTDCFHLKDSDKNNRHVPAGRGAAGIREILTDAIKRKWDGPLSIEPHLIYSQAVLATGPSGQANEDFSKMTPAESFHVAATAATQLLHDIRAPLA